MPESERYYSEDTNWGVYTFSTTDDIPEFSEGRSCPFEGEEKKKFSIIAGKMQRLYLGSDYDVQAELLYDAKYKSYQYKPKIISAVVPKTEEQQRRFLESLVTPKQAEALVSAYPNIVEDTVNNREIDIKKLRGIKEATWKNIREKIIDNYVISDILILLQPLGVSFAMIQKLISSEPNPALLKEQLLENPYIMTRIRGLGFKRVDALALKLNPEIRVSSKRVYAFIKHFFKELGDNAGHTWVTESVLENAVIDNINECLDEYHKVIEIEKKANVVLHFDGDKVGLKQYWDVEARLLDTLNNLNQYKRKWDIDINAGIAEAEKAQGFNLTDEQKEIIRRSTKSNISIIAGKAGCVDCDTEFFNGETWKPISQYCVGEKVMQYNLDGTSSLVYPLDYVKEKCGTLHLIQNHTKSVNQCICDLHNLVVKTSKGNIIKKNYREFYEQHYSTELGAQWKFISSFMYDSESKINISDSELRVMIAVIADGTIARNKRVIKLLKERKIARMEMLLQDANIAYDKKVRSDGYTCFVFYPPLEEKHFTSRWYKTTKHQREIIANELQYWDARYKKDEKHQRSIIIYTNNKTDADYIQFVYSSIGNRASLREQDRIGQVKSKTGYFVKSKEYLINVSPNLDVSLRARRKSNFNNIKDYKTKDGYKYCFTVPSGMLVLRREGTINVTGNCGKTTIARALLSVYKNYSINCCALSAKAAQRITEATGHPASTIHRLLQYQGAKFLCCHENPLQADIIFVDECSMINSEIFLALISAIKEGSKVILCGDNRQLPPIGYGNIFSDLLDMEDVFNVNRLTQVLRQAEKSGILSDANKIRDGINPLHQPELKIITGELQDMTYMFRDSRESLRSIAIRTYLKAIQSDGLDDVVIITPRKSDCVNCTTEINRMIQDELIEDSVQSIKYGDKKFRVGAKVIQRENNYNKNVFNGEIGYLSKIWEEGIGKERHIYFEVSYNNGDKLIQYSRNEIDQIDLAYALTIHLSQGSGYKTVISIIDNTHYALLDTCLLYTALTRAKKRCLLLAEPTAFKRCIHNNNSVNRQTWLGLQAGDNSL